MTKPTPLLRGTLNEMISAILSSCDVHPGTLDYEYFRTIARDELLAAWRNGGFIIGRHRPANAPPCVTLQ